MKKNLIFKIAVIILFLFFLISAFILLPHYIKALNSRIYSLQNDTQEVIIAWETKKWLAFNIFQIVHILFSVLFSGIICFIVWFKDAKILTENAIDRIHATKETLEEEKRAKLKREIAEKQAELEKMNNEPTDTE